MSLVYALGVAIFGGFGQFIVTYLIQATGSPIAPAWYVMPCALATIVSLFTIPEIRGGALSSARAARQPARGAPCHE